MLSIAEASPILIIWVLYQPADAMEPQAVFLLQVAILIIVITAEMLPQKMIIVIHYMQAEY